MNQPAPPRTCPTCHEPVPAMGVICPLDGTVLVPAAEDPLIGQKVGEYEVTHRLGMGGMGVVYAGVQPIIGKLVAIKCLHWHYSRDPAQVRRLVNEARAVNTIRHRGIVDIFGMGSLPDGREYLVMERLEGDSLDSVLAARNGPMPIDRIVELARELCEVLQAAHAQGVIHRDVKPSNVFLVRPPHGPVYPKLLDFGLAKLKDPSARDAAQSEPTGTPDYASPEQIRGEPVEPRTDLYCLGVTLFRMLTGQLPFKGPGRIDVMHQHLHDEPPAVRLLRPDVPPALEALVAQLLQKDVDDRPASAAAVLESLKALGPVAAPVPGEASSGSSGGSSYPGRPATAPLARDERGLGALIRSPLGVLASVLVLGLLLASALVALRALDARRTLAGQNPNAEGQGAPATTAAPPAEEAAREAQALADEVRARMGQLLLGGDSAVEHLEAGWAKLGPHPVLTEVRKELVQRLSSEGRSALEQASFARAEALLSKAVEWAPQDSRLTAAHAEARRGVLAEGAGMVRAGEVWIDRYEWPNRAGALPETRVDWATAQERCASVGKRLCTETEWERACAGPRGLPFPYGKRFALRTCQTGTRGLAPAGRQAGCASAEGALDLSGNVAEWTASEVRPGAPQRVVRGGSFGQRGQKVSCQARDYFLPGQGGARHLGFRCCL